MNSASSLVTSITVALPPSLLADVQLLVVAGGCSYADALGAGRLWSLALTHGVGDALDGACAHGGAARAFNCPAA